MEGKEAADGGDVRRGGGGGRAEPGADDGHAVGDAGGEGELVLGRLHLLAGGRDAVAVVPVLDPLLGDVGGGEDADGDVVAEQLTDGARAAFFAGAALSRIRTIG